LVSTEGSRVLKQSRDPVVIFNEYSGNKLVHEAVDKSGMPAVKRMLPTAELAGFHGVWSELVGSLDLSEWMDQMATAVSPEGRFSGALFDTVCTSVQLILRQLNEFIVSINCHAEDPAFHCDLHPKNIRLAVGAPCEVVQVYVIDFDMARTGSCEGRQRSASMSSGATVKVRELVRRLADFPAGQDPTLTDWGFYYTTCHLLYKMLAKLSATASRRKVLQSRCP
jgi:hypothetical protein